MELGRGWIWGGKGFFFFHDIEGWMQHMGKNKTPSFVPHHLDAVRPSAHVFIGGELAERQGQQGQSARFGARSAMRSSKLHRKREGKKRIRLICRGERVFASCG